MVSEAPTLKDILPVIGAAISGRELVIYNAAYDRQYLPANLLKNVQKIHCAMLRFAKYRGIWNDFYNGWKWHKLDVAAAHFGYEWTGTAHRALADALACRYVWRCLEGREQRVSYTGNSTG